MKRRNFTGATLLSLVGAGSATAAPGLRIGLTAVILADQAAFLARWSDYLSKRVGEPIQFVVRESYQVILDLLFVGQIDAAWICGYPYVRNHTRLRILAVPLYQGQPLYQAYLIRQAGSAPEINGWSDLKGRVLAYSDPLSNSGWLVAQHQMQLAGLAPSDLRRTFFARSHRNVAEAVAAGLAHAGSIDGYVWETMKLQNAAATAATEVIWKSDRYGFPPLVARHVDTSSAVEQLARALIGMRDMPNALPLLNALNLDGFVAADPALFDSVRALAAAVERPRA